MLPSAGRMAAAFRRGPPRPGGDLSSCPSYLRDASPTAGSGVRRALLVEGGGQPIHPLTLAGRVHRRDIDLLTQPNRFDEESDRLAAVGTGVLFCHERHGSPGSGRLSQRFEQVWTEANASDPATVLGADP